MDEIDRIGAELRAEIVRARREDATEPKPYGLHDGPTNRLPDDSTEETVVCLRRFDPVLKQFVFEPLPAPRREDAAGERTSFALAAELLATAEWIAERTASPGNQRRLDVLQRAIGFLRGDSRGELIDVRYLIRNDAACAAIAAHVRTEEIARHAAALSTAEREREALDWINDPALDITRAENGWWVVERMTVEDQRPTWKEIASGKTLLAAIENARARVPSGGET